MSPDCVRCAEVEGRAATPGGVIFDDGMWHVTHHPSGYTDPGELIVKTRRHCESVAQLTREEAAALGPVLRAAVAAVEQVVRPERVYVACFGERVRHVHFFLLPRGRDLPAGHVVSDLYRKGRGHLRRLGIVRNPLPKARADAASRMRELWPGLMLLLELLAAPLRPVDAQQADTCPRGRADDQATMVSGTVVTPRFALRAAVDTALHSLGYRINPTQSRDDQWVTDARFRWPGGAPPEGWAHAANPGMEVVVDLAAHGDSTVMSIAASMVCRVAVRERKPGEAEASLEASAALEVAEGIGHRLRPVSTP